jgi:hypothetical protein
MLAITFIRVVSYTSSLCYSSMEVLNWDASLFCFRVL